MSSFSTTVTNKGPGGESFEIPLAGAQRGVLVGLIDLGTQLQKGFQGGPDEDVHQLMLVFELIDARMSGQARNHTIGAVYRVSMHQKAGMRKLFEGWRGRPFADGEAFDPANALGHYGMVNVVHKTSGDGGTFAKLESVSGLILPQGTPAPQPTLPVILYEIGKGTSIKQGGQLVFQGQAPPSYEWIPFIYGKNLSDKLKEAVENGRPPLGHQQRTSAVSANGGTNGSHGAQPATAAATDNNAIPF